MDGRHAGMRRPHRTQPSARRHRARTSLRRADLPMRILGALAAGLFVFYGVGLLTGHAPTLRLGLGKSRNADIGKRKLWLRQAGLELTPIQYFAGLSAVGIATFAVFTVITGTPAVALVPAAIAVALPHTFFGRRRL